ncbi:MAG: NDP-sugar synthase [Proteobacteria bacterium]|nr:NDP-sugar synthase [Pseudomonadota bacterium]
MEDKKLKAMVLAAGIGSRLEPLTSILPKPLVQIAGRPVMEHILLLLKKHGITDVVSNTYHLAPKLHDYFADIKQREGIDIHFIHESKLSGVAGGIRACKEYLKGSTVCIIMGDALTNADLTKLLQAHLKAVKENNCKVTIAKMQVEDTKHFGVVVTDGKGRVINFQEKPKPEEALSNWANTGIYFFEPEILDMIPDVEEAPTYDVAHDLFPKLLEAGIYMQAVAVDADIYWADIGTPQQYIQTMKDIASGSVNFESFKPLIRSQEISPLASLIEDNEIGDKTVIADTVSLKNCVIWDNVEIGEGAELEDCIVVSGAKISPYEKHKGKILVAEMPVATK